MPGTQRALLALALAYLVQACGGFSWAQCGDGAFAVKDVTLTPDPVAAGDNAVFKITADSGAEVQAGTIQMSVKLAGIPIWMQNDDLCQKTECPVAKGPAEVVYLQPMPIFTPPGQYVVTMRGVSEASDLLFCVEVTFQVTPPGGGAGAGYLLQQSAGKLLGHRKELV